MDLIFFFHLVMLVMLRVKSYRTQNILRVSIMYTLNLHSFVNENFWCFFFKTNKSSAENKINFWKEKQVFNNVIEKALYYCIKSACVISF